MANEGRDADDVDAADRDATRTDREMLPMPPMSTPAGRQIAAKILSPRTLHSRSSNSSL